MDLIEIILKEIKKPGKTRYRIAQDTGVTEAQLHRFINGGSLKAETVGTLLEYFGYEVRKKEGKAKEMKQKKVKVKVTKAPEQEPRKIKVMITNAPEQKPRKVKVEIIKEPTSKPRTVRIKMKRKDGRGR